MPKLDFNLEECKLLAHALNSCKVGNYSPAQQEALPALGRKLADYLADPNAEKRVYKNQKRLKPKKKLIGFALTRSDDKELQQIYDDMNASVEPHPTVIVDDKFSLPVVAERETYAVLRGEK